MLWWTLRNLKSTNQLVRVRALVALGVPKHYGDSKIADLVTTALTDRSIDVRLAAISALKNIGEPRNQLKIIPMLDDPEDSVRKEAAAALDGINDQIAKDALDQYRRREQHKQEMREEANERAKLAEKAKEEARVSALRARRAALPKHRLKALEYAEGRASRFPRDVQIQRIFILLTVQNLISDQVLGQNISDRLCQECTVHYHRYPNDETTTLLTAILVRQRRAWNKSFERQLQMQRFNIQASLTWGTDDDGLSASDVGLERLAMKTIRDHWWAIEELIEHCQGLSIVDPDAAKQLSKKPPEEDWVAFRDRNPKLDISVFATEMRAIYSALWDALQKNSYNKVSVPSNIINTSYDVASHLTGTG